MHTVIQTSMTESIFDDKPSRDFMKAATPLPWEGTPSDVAKAAVFLASSDATWVTGVPLPVDGGFLSH